MVKHLSIFKWIQMFSEHSFFLSFLCTTYKYCTQKAVNTVKSSRFNTLQRFYNTAVTHRHTQTWVAMLFSPVMCSSSVCIYLMLIIGLNMARIGSVVSDTLTSVSRSHPVIKGSHLSASCFQSHALCHKVVWARVLLLLLNWTILISWIPYWKTLLSDALRPECGSSICHCLLLCVCLCINIMMLCVVKGFAVSVRGRCGTECMLERNHVWTADNTVGCFVHLF